MSESQIAKLDKAFQSAAIGLSELKTQLGEMGHTALSNEILHIEVALCNRAEALKAIADEAAQLEKNVCPPPH